MLSAGGAALNGSHPKPWTKLQALWNPASEFQLKASKRYITIASPTVLL
jgi:hypothetical protein